jgi:spermidine synthase
MNELDLLALKYGTDKASDFHNYTEFYDKYFNLDRGNIKNVLEIGVFRGNSLRMWKDYFFNAIIYGIDIDKNCNFTEERIKILIDDQVNINLLNLLPNDFDIIIDDGGHFSSQQIKSFEMLFSKVKSGGVYIVEDVCCSYWESYNAGSNQTAIEYFKTLIDHVNFFGTKINGSNQRSREFILGGKFNASVFEKTIDYILFTNSIILIKKV